MAPSAGRRAPWTLPAGWPVAALVAGYPVWWVLGLTEVILPLAAVPLALQLVRTRQKLRPPRGAGLWGLFLLWVVLSVVAMDVVPEGTLPPSGGGRYVAVAARLANYVAATVVLLYVGNASERVLPRRRVITWMALLAVWMVALGLVSLVLPGARVPTPLGALLPGGSASAPLAQVQSILGASAPRPAAPFAYTNIWGYVLSLLLVWVVVGWVVLRSGRGRLLGVGLLVAAVVPLVLSLNRGVWLGLALAIAYAAVRLALRGKLLAVGALVVVVLVGGGATAATPLGDVVSARADAGHSDSVRETLARDAVRVAVDSPVLGYGTTRAARGSASSIAVGPSPDCPQCGSRNIGSTGQLWLLLVSQGMVGAALYFSFFASVLWSARRDHSAVGIAGSAVVLLSLYYSTIYVALNMPLVITLLSVALLWRNGRDASTPLVPAAVRP